jgi:hypothetical protein
MLPLEKAKWFSYAFFTLLFMPLTLTSTVMESFHPITMWLISILILHIDVLGHYWNHRVFHISFTYAFIAYVWRLIRSIALIIDMLSHLELALRNLNRKGFL